MVWTRDALINLRAVLANNYPTVADSRRFVADIGLNPAQIEFDPKAINNWFQILEYAKPRNKLDDIVKHALEENPENEALQAAQAGTPPPILEGPDVDWHGPNIASALEKIIGTQSTLVPITYLELGLVRSKAVARVKRDDGSSGTGFLTEGDLLITNNHVLSNVEEARSSIVQLNYQATSGGLNAPIDEFRLLPEKSFKTSTADDWTAVLVDGNPSAKWGYLELAAAQSKVGDYVNIIQHPGGGPKQISFMANVIVFVDSQRVQYLTDTLPGSSGSPVFDTEWNVIALHHSGGWLAEPKSATKIMHYRNEGILIDRVIAGLKGQS
jgi:V8-like Glu-specific endopeptidase